MKNNKIFFNFFLYTFLVLSLFGIVHISKQYFHINYNKHDTIESNLSLYKVSSNTSDNLQTLRQPKIIEVNAVDVHPEPTAIILENQKQLNTPITSKPELVTKIKKNKKNNTKQKVVKEKKKSKKITKPKTLIEERSITKSVLNNPLFRTFAVQTGAFKNINDAQSHRIKIKQLKTVSNYTIDILHYQNLHKVVIGYFENATTARDICTQIKKQNVQCFTTQVSL